MRLLFVHSHKFMELEEKYYTSGQFPYELFKTRYLNNFKKVTICSRVLNAKDVKNYKRSDGEGVLFKELPNLSVIKNRRNAIKSTKRILEKEVLNTDVVVARMPSMHAYIAMKIAMKYKKTLVVEVVGNVFESLWNHGSLLGKILAPISSVKYRKLIKSSTYTIYVTEKQLQQKYPSAKDAYTIHASNVELEPTTKSILSKRIEREVKRPSSILKIGLIGSYTTKYKGIHNGIDLIAYLRKKGINAELHILGSGNNDWLLDKAQKLDVLNNVYFHSLLPAGAPVLEWLDKLDLYIQPSLTEGLPRALIEAMSRGLPAVASNVGGIPELIESQFLHKPNDSKGLVRKVLSLINNKEKMIDQVQKNFEKSQEYSTNVLRKRRDDFWKYVIGKEFTT